MKIASDRPPHPVLRAAVILHTAEVARHTHGGSLAYQVGWYEGEIKVLCAELASLKGHGHTPSIGCDLAHVRLGDADVLAEYAYQSDPDDPDPEILRLLVNGAWCDAANVAPAQIERWTEEIAEDLRRQAAEPADDAVVARPYG